MYLKIAIIVAVLVTAFAQRDCGRTPSAPTLDSRFDNEIVGGTQAAQNAWPWQITWCRGTDTSCSLMCGGSVIAPNWIMTAAHCCSGQLAALIRVRAGTNRFSDFSQGVTRRVTRIVMHPNYNSNTLANDVCVAQLDSALTYDNTIQPVCLPSNDDNMQTSGTTYYVTGWGSTNEGGSISQNLMQVEVPYVDFDRCNAAYSPQYPIDRNTMVCAGVVGKDSCQGDSGGPMVYRNSDNTWSEIGIVSWGIGCARDGYPGVYARTSAFCNFISSTTGISDICVSK